MVRGLRLSFLAPFALLAAAISLITYFFFISENYQPLHRLGADDIRVFTDDMDRESLIECSRRQVAYLKKQDPQKVIAFGTDYYDNRWLLLSQEEFLEKLQQHPRADELDRFLRDNYLFYQAGGRKDRRGRHMLVTGYYEPTFQGSLTGRPPFLTPLYTPPKSLVTVKGNDGDRIDRTGRYDNNNQLVDYWSRAEIETTGVLAGNELVFLKDPFDAFLLHVQGSGKIRLNDNSIRSVRFAGSNGLRYNSIGKLLVDEKKMALEDVNIPAIRGYLIDNPEEVQRILHHNPRFIFFDWGDARGPRGSSGEILTPGRSIALDGSALPGQTLGYLVSRMPIVGADGQIIGWKPLTRFVFPQDSGAAIKGTGRVDIFWGDGEYAEIAANHMKEEGKLYFLVKKGYPGE